MNRSRWRCECTEQWRQTSLLPPAAGVRSCTHFLLISSSFPDETREPAAGLRSPVSSDLLNITQPLHHLQLWLRSVWYFGTKSSECQPPQLRCVVLISGRNRSQLEYRRSDSFCGGLLLEISKYCAAFYSTVIWFSLTFIWFLVNNILLIDKEKTNTESLTLSYRYRQNNMSWVCSKQPVWTGSCLCLISCFKLLLQVCSIY